MSIRKTHKYSNSNFRKGEKKKEKNFRVPTKSFLALVSLKNTKKLQQKRKQEKIYNFFLEN